MSITQTTEPGQGSGVTSATVQVNFSGLAPGQRATLALTSGQTGHAIAIATVLAAADGTATAALTVSQPTAGPVAIRATAANQICVSALSPAPGRPSLSCQTG